MSVLAELRANIQNARKEACDQIARLTTANQKLAKECDELADDNVNLQVEVMHWQDEWFTKALEKQVSGYMRINSDLIAENEALRAYITRLLS